MKSLCSAGLCCAALAFAGGAAGDDAPQPHVVIVLCDDLGYGDLSCYGHPHIKTPQLDALAADSLRLTSCYSSAPVCSPSRVGLLTGRSPNRAGVYDWIPAAAPGSRRPDQRQQVHLRRSEATLARQLRRAGYDTCAVGKWHCNSMFNSDAQPQPDDAGFDHYFATQNNASPSHANPVNFVRNGQPVGQLEGYSCQLVVDEAIRWLDSRESDAPYLLFTAFHEPHEPVASPKSLVAEYREVAENEDEAQYFANVANVDRAVGRLVADLKRRGHWKNTFFVFTSDNGPETLRRYRGARRSYGRPGPLRGMKLWTTDAGFRVAGIISWPGKIEPGISSEVVSALDLLPTCCRLGGAPLPDRPLDGVDLSAWLQGDEPLRRPQPLLWCYYNAINQQRVAMRDGPWKLLAQLDGGRLPKLQNVHAGNVQRVAAASLTDFELYRIAEDLSEAHDLSAEQPALTKRLSEKMRRAYQQLRRDSHVWQPAPSK